MPVQPLRTTIDRHRADLRATTQPFPQARTPPGRLFFDPEVYHYDLTEIFGRHWLCVGHRSRLTAPGSFLRVEVGDESLLIVRDRQDRLAAFFNVCRHRGTRLTTRRSGVCRGFTCPYHAWHYDLNGSLTSAPLMDDSPGFERSNHSLVRANVEEFLGFVFVNLDEAPPTLASEYADFPNLERFRLPDLECVVEHRYEVETNWKIVCQNYHECYHCPVAHPELHRVSGPAPGTDTGASGRLFIGGPMALREGFSTLTKSGIATRPPLPGATRDDERSIHYFNLLPNFLLSIAPDYVLTHHVWPRGPEAVVIESHWLFARTQISEPDFDSADAVDFWDTTNRQDWSLCENALKGLKSAHHRPGPYQASEQCTHRFDRWYGQNLLNAFP